MCFLGHVLAFIPVHALDPLHFCDCEVGNQSVTMMNVCSSSCWGHGKSEHTPMAVNLTAGSHIHVAAHSVLEAMKK